MVSPVTPHPGEDSPEKQKAAWRDLPRNVWVVTVTSFLTDVSSEMVLNLVPLFLANVLGVRTAIIGLIEGIAEMAASLLKAFSGWLSDRLGQRKWLAVGGYSLSTLAKPFLYFANTWGWVLGVRFADRLGKGIRTAPRDALIADSITERHRGLAFGLHRAGDTAGALVGLLVAFGVIWVWQGSSLNLARSAFQTVVLFSIIPAALAVLILAVGVKDMPTQSSASHRVPNLSLKGFEIPFKRFLVVIILFTLGNSSDAFIILRAQERGLNVLGVIGMLITFNLVYSLVSGPAGALSDQLGRRRIMIGGWLTYAIIYLGFALASSIWQVWALFALYGLYYGMAEGTGKAMVADLVQPDQRGTAYGLYNAAVGLTILPASLVAGILWQGVGDWPGFGPGAPFFFGALLALVAVMLLIWWIRL
jgi:MFS family permease